MILALFTNVQGHFEPLLYKIAESSHPLYSAYPIQGQSQIGACPSCHKVTCRVHAGQKTILAYCQFRITSLPNMYVFGMWWIRCTLKKPSQPVANTPNTSLFFQKKFENKKQPSGLSFIQWGLVAVPHRLGFGVSGRRWLTLVIDCCPLIVEYFHRAGGQSF